ncbi:histidinol-phosphate transaminase [Candidatus Reidiella endopervernicosa]|uniref:Histidinol-phosphate aminotransferase n=1 Tax=Candidatus Reidiella endopervernicosa TaxID=2738883 RepID=A0A6N0HUV9_9GAMM|nr:histidinol-phosphate transaminase [Candidatus Reidiella endopervernicosa]QKQ26172.1 histidinol-phosphate transaminase [Candidatus Reidiella endopervernicosa]
MSLDDKINHWIRPEIRELSAYHVPDPGELIKLDAMENPYRWPDAMLESWQRQVREIAVNRYPDPAASSLTAALRRSMDIPAGMGVMLGNGSDEIIQILALAFGGPKRVVLAPEPSFVMYRMIATFSSLEYHGVPLKPDFSLDLAAMLQAIEQHDPAVVYLAYPNNPTGNLFDEEAIVKILEAANGVVVVDEAYHAFAGKSFMPRLGEFDNLLVMRTLSKLGLAGLRLGLIAGPAEWIGEFDKLRLPYNINVMTQAAAEFALDNIEVFDEQTRLIREERTRLFDEMGRLEGIELFPSAANFILFSVPSGRAGEIFESIKADGVLIKNMKASEGPLADTLRVTVGAAEENSAFLSVLSKALG